MDRRLFTKAIALGSASTFFSYSGLEGSVFQDKQLGVALVGLGNYATNQLAPALLETKHCRLAGIVTGSPEKADSWASKYSIADHCIYNYENFDEIADNPEIDIVYVVLPNSMHCEFVKRAAEAGKHVITEKPMATTLEDAKDMVDTCKAKGVNLGVGYRLHYEPYNLEMRKICSSGSFGNIKMIQADFGFTIGDPTQWRLKKDMAGGGALMDVGIYCIQAARYCTGLEPVAVTAQEFKTDNDKFREVDETLSWQMEFPGGLVASCTTSYAINIHKLDVRFERGWARLSPAFDYGPLQGTTSNPEVTMDFPNVVEQALHMDDFALSVLQKTPVKVPGEEGLKDMKVITGIYESIRRNSTKVPLRLI